MTQKELSKLRSDYLDKREKVLKNKVSSLAVKLFDRIFEQYLVALQQDKGVLTYNDHNINLIAGLDSIYDVFNQQLNIEIIKGFVGDLNEIMSLNEKYFKNIAKRGINAESEIANSVVNRNLGITKDGKINRGGFIDQFTKDKTLIKQIKKISSKSIIKGVSFSDFRNDIKIIIEGDPKIPTSGGLHSYYRNYAYDTYQKVDRLAGQSFAKELSLRYFFYQGGLIKTSRPICEFCNGKIIDSFKFKNLKYDQLKEEYRFGIPNGSPLTWNPLNDLGGYGCKHLIDWIADSVAKNYGQKILDLSALKS